MIPALDLALLEQALDDYLSAYFAAEGVTVREANAEVSGSFANVAPPILRGLGSEPQAARSPAVVIFCNDAPAEIPGVYGEDLEAVIVTATPIVIEGITEADHRALHAHVLAAFPGRPKPGADDTAWQAIHADINGHVEPVTGYRLQGFNSDSAGTGKSKDRVESILRWQPGLIHPDLLPAV